MRLTPFKPPTTPDRVLEVWGLNKPGPMPPLTGIRFAVVSPIRAAVIAGTYPDAGPTFETAHALMVEAIYHPDLAERIDARVMPAVDELGMRAEWGRDDEDAERWDGMS